MITNFSRVCSLGLAVLCFSPVLHGAQPISTETGNATLNSISRLSSVSPDEAAKALPVKLQGTVTYYDHDRGVLFLQDGTEGVSVRIAGSKENDDVYLQPGQIVEVEGTTTRGRLRGGIKAKTCRVVAEGELIAAVELPKEALFSGSNECRLVRVKGWIPAVSASGSRLNFGLVIGPGQSMDVTANDGEPSEVKGLPGCMAEVSGVWSARFDGSGRISGARLSLTNAAAIHKIKSLPVAPIAEAGGSLGKVEVEPFRVRGTVVNHSLGEFLIVRDNSGSLRVPYRGLNYFNAGNLVEVFAYPLQQRPTMQLTNVIVKLVPPDSSNEEPVAAIITPSAPNTNLITLKRVTQIRKLSPQEASRGYPIDITGVITFWDFPSYLHFIQDETSGIYFDVTKVEKLAPLRAGQKVQIKGFSGPGDYAPVVIAQTVKIFKDEPFPSPESVSFRKLMSGNFDSQWVLLKGVVRNQWIGTNSSTLAVFAGDGVLKVLVPGPAPGTWTTNLVDAGIEVQGVCRTIFDERRRLQGVELQVPDWSQVSVKDPAATDPFQLPVKAVGDLFQFQAGGGELHRARLMGVVTLRSPDGSFYLQDGSGGIQIQPGQGISTLQVGTMADVVGFPVIVDKLAMLQEAVVHPMKHNTTVEPTELKPDVAVEDALQATVIRIQGQLLGYFSHGSEELLTVRFGQRLIDVTLEKETEQDLLAQFEPGTVVRLTGVCLARPDNAGNIQSFRLLLRSEADVVVISRPAWWTVQRTLWASTGLAGVLLLALGWVRALRRQVQQRTGELHAEVEHHKRTEAKLEAEIAERKRMETEVERSHQELLIASRQAGMAEVATSVLHNVGNVLNSVNVSAGLVSDKIRKSKVANMARAAEMIKAHSSDLAHFLEHDLKGRQLPQYLGRLADHLNTEQTAILAELDSLRKNVEHIKGIVGMQQSYAKVFGSAELVKPSELVEDALRLNSGALVRHDVRVLREYEPNLPEITVDKHKLLQILVNLICNAKKACDESPAPEKLLTVRIGANEKSVKISVIDNGVGIPAENLTRIFNHGFTTRKDGHGFGLHSGALAAKEMGGALVAQSEGRGKGAQFTVELPVQTVAAGADASAPKSAT